MPFARQILLASYQIYAALMHFYAVCIECFLTNFRWRGRRGSEAWLNCTRVASRLLFLEHLIEILSKKRAWWQMVEWRGLYNKFESFCHGCFLLDYTSGMFMCGCLKMKKFVAGALRSRNFYSVSWHRYSKAKWRSPDREWANTKFYPSRL